MNICSICDYKRGKYKCPICLVYYCSVGCCRKHRENKCDVLIRDPPPATTQAKPKFVTEDTVSPENLELLRNDEELKNILSNPHLRDMLVNLDNSADPEEAMQKAMLEPIFVEFADACLKVVEPPEKT